MRRCRQPEVTTRHGGHGQNKAARRRRVQGYAATRPRWPSTSRDHLSWVTSVPLWPPSRMPPHGCRLTTSQTDTARLSGSTTQKAGIRWTRKKATRPPRNCGGISGSLSRPPLFRHSKKIVVFPFFAHGRDTENRFSCNLPCSVFMLNNCSNIFDYLFSSFFALRYW